MFYRSLDQKSSFSSKMSFCSSLKFEQHQQALTLLGHRLLAVKATADQEQTSYFRVLTINTLSTKQCTIKSPGDLGLLS